MCGRLVIYSPIQRYADYFGVTSSIVLKPSYNIPPTSSIPVCRADPQGIDELVMMRWGLVPRWSKGPDSRFSMFNARAETVHEKPAYRSAFKKQRCLIPADGFYEWTQANGKQPYYIHRKDDDLMAFAGLWEHWQDDEGHAIDSCTIIVTAANALMKPIHDRMPVILNTSQFSTWLDPQNHAIDDLHGMLKPYAGDELESYAVPRDVNSPKNDSAGLIERNG